jgi:hypothetical protein
MFGLLPPIPHRATLGVPQLWRPNRPPQLRQGAAPEVKVQTGPNKSKSVHTSSATIRIKQGLVV